MKKTLTYTQQEHRWIKKHHKRPRRAAHAEFCQIFKHPDVSLPNFNSLCKREGWMTGRTGCF